MSGMRNRLIYSYSGVDYDIVWDAVATKIPLLHDELIMILREVEGEITPD